MKKLQAVVFVCLTGLAGSALADRYEVLELGPSPVTYIEHRASVNDASQVAWTTLVTHSGSQVPRARLISRDGQNMRLCLFIDCVDANEANTDLKSWAIRNAGSTVCTESGGACRRGNASPARGARGICRTVDANGVADIEIYDYDCEGTRNEDAYVFIEVSTEGNVDSKTCDQMDYTLYYGNDSVGNGNSGSGGAGCATCCN